VDEATSGKNFQGQTVGSLAPLLVSVSRTLAAPSGGTLYDEWRVSRAAELGVKAETVADAQLADTHIGSGSDHTVFLNFLGVPVANLTFVGPYGVYHSLYDDYFWMNEFGDPGYKYHALMTQLWGVTALRLANADVLPFDFDFYADNIRQFLDDLDQGTHVKQHVSVANLQKQMSDFQAAGRELNEAVLRATEADEAGADGSGLNAVNEALMQAERNWCNPAGIPGRPWFKHSIYATRFTYAHLELPGLTEAAEEGDWPRATAQAQVLSDELAKNTATLRLAIEKLHAATGATHQ
jgi:N-acetylated-alpha-linked acidic dipeptidase